MIERMEGKYIENQRPLFVMLASGWTGGRVAAALPARTEDTSFFAFLVRSQSPANPAVSHFLRCSDGGLRPWRLLMGALNISLSATCIKF